MTTAKTFIEHHGDRLPSPNGVALAITELWQHEDTSIDQLARVIQTDPALSGRLLKLANSAAMGSGARPIAAVPEAIVRVGMRTVGQLAVTFSLIDNAKDGHCEAFDYRGFWSQSLLTALLGRALAQTNAVAAPDDIFACGLLARSGALALATIHPDAYSEILLAEGGSLGAREKQHFGFDHCELSYELMINFGVPDALAGPARHHRDARQTPYGKGTRPQKLAITLHLAHAMAILIASSSDPDNRVARDRLRELSKLGEFSMDQLAGVCDTVIPEWRDWARMLDLPEDFEGDLQSIAAEVAQAGEIDGAADTAADSSSPAALIVGAADSTRFASLLEQQGYRVSVCTDGNPGRRAAEEPAPLLVLLDAREDAADAAKQCQWLRDSPWGSAAYLMALREGSNRAADSRLFSCGVDGLFDTDDSDSGFVARLVAVRRLGELQGERTQERQRTDSMAAELAATQDQIQSLSLEDPLTLLPNRKAALLTLKQAWAASQRGGSPLSLLMIDLDQFRRINDRVGHDIGDQVLKFIAQALKPLVRREEPLFRLGGGEFLVVSSVSELKPMLIAAERLRASLAAMKVPAGDETIRVSVSVGLAERHAGDAEVDDLLAAASRAIYLAKREGRNRTAFRVAQDYRLVPKR